MSPVLPILLAACGSDPTPTQRDATTDSQDSAASDACPSSPWTTDDPEPAYEDYPVYIAGTDRRFLEVQGGVWGAETGDEVVVCPGTYRENIDLKGKVITLRSASGAASTVLDGGGAGPTVTLRLYEPAETVLQGFTITGGTGSEGHGGGIFVEWGSPTIRQNIVTGNTAGIAAGIYVRNGAATVENNVVYGNVADQAGAFGCSACSGAFRYNTLYENTATRGPVGEWFWGIGDLVGNVLVVRETDSAAIFWLDPRDEPFETSYNLLWPEIPIIEGEGWPEGEGWVYADPLLVDPEGGDWRLGDRSPAIDAGPPDALDADGTRSDLGAFGGPFGDWSER